MALTFTSYWTHATLSGCRRYKGAGDDGLEGGETGVDIVKLNGGVFELLLQKSLLTRPRMMSVGWVCIKLCRQSCAVDDPVG